MKNIKGFSLTELLIVLSIISILAMIAIPGYIGQRKGAARTEAAKNLEAIRLLEEQFLAENGTYTWSAADVASIQGMLPGFQPGPDTNYNYQIMQDVAVNTPITSPPTWGVPQNPCFTAVATGKVDSRVEGDTFVIDCNYNKNY